ARSVHVGTPARRQRCQRWARWERAEKRVHGAPAREPGSSRRALRGEHRRHCSRYLAPISQFCSRSTESPVIVPRPLYRLYGTTAISVAYVRARAPVDLDTLPSLNIEFVGLCVTARRRRDGGTVEWHSGTAR
ncbi:hypothetical protein C8F04DRAFT_1393446, partial [Mycena alexandri]